MATTTPRPVADARRVLLGALVDYAGLFPPARLALPDAVGEYLELRRARVAWIVGRFACPVGELGRLAEILAPDAAVPVSVIVPGAKAEEQLARARDDVERAGGALRVELVETVLPGAAGPGEVEALVAAVADAVPTVSGVFLEVPADPAALDAALDTLAAARPRVPVGPKLRTGGLAPEAVPSSAFVAAFVEGCVRRELRAAKATAGLHRPWRGPDHELGVPTHGFLNLLGAAGLALRGAPVAELEAILEDDDEAAVQLDADGLRWRGRRLEGALLERVRREVIASFGSCSVAEPVAHLRRLGFLPA